MLGFGARATVEVTLPRVEPARASVGQAVTVAFGLRNPQVHAQNVLVDFCIHYVKASGQTSPRV